ncbi:MAG: OmpA family protein [Pseudomonadales bacterium]|nr:OmpA family protein [Pseudomonadales bacterium]
MADKIYHENFIVQGNACVGFDCVNGESFGNDVLRLKENNNRIRFWDAVNASDDIHSLELKANDSSNGGANFFSFEYSLISPIFGDGITEGYDAEGNIRVMGIDEQLYSYDNGNYNVPNLAPEWSYSNVALLKFKKAEDGENKYAPAITLGHGSTAVAGTLSVGSDALLRKIKYVAQGLNDSDMLISALINHYDPLSHQKLRASELQQQLSLLSTQLTELENWVTAAELQDNDGDGLNDYIDDDDDNDKVADVNDAFPLDGHEQLDHDGDGIGDNADLDDDNDGISDIDEGAESLLDSDKDGLPNFQDTDSDNDGILDINENGDFNGDGINDSQQVEGEIDSFGGALSFAYLLFAVLLSLARRPMLIVTALISLLSLSFSTQAAKTQCLSWKTESAADCFFLGAGAGFSLLQTDTENSAWKIDDDVAGNYSIFVGRTLTQHWSVELGYSQLGKTELSHNNPAVTDKQSIEYAATYIKAKRTVYSDAGRFSVNANGGLAWLTSQASSGIKLEQDKTVKATLGLAANWKFNDAWQAEARADYYMDAASVFNVALVYHFGQSSSRLSAEALSQQASKISTESETQRGLTLPASAHEDKSRPSSCQLLSGTQLTLYFDPLSDELNATSQQRLKNWVATLEHKDQIEFMLEGHSDKQGTALNNLKISRQRASSVVRALVDQGFAEKNLDTDGSGEFNLLSVDDDSLNRRVEIWVLRDYHCDLQAGTSTAEFL